MCDAGLPRHLNPADDRPHTPTDEPWWGEWWRFDFAGGDGGLAGLVRICLLHNQRTVWYWASLVGPGRLPVVVHDDEVALPRPGSLEIRAEGLWADHIIEVPLEQVTVGCEAFALRLDDPVDIADDPVLGERIPFGLDLEWETVKDTAVGRAAIDSAVERAFEWEGVNPGEAAYQLACDVHGDVLVADDRIHIETGGRRWHGWGMVRGTSKPQWRAERGP